MVTGIKENLKIDEKVLHVTDAAFYTEENHQTIGSHTIWVCRVPMVILEADLLRKQRSHLSLVLMIATHIFLHSLITPESGNNGLSFTQVNNRRGRRSHLKRRLRRNLINQENLSNISHESVLPVDRMLKTQSMTGS